MFKTALFKGSSSNEWVKYIAFYVLEDFGTGLSSQVVSFNLFMPVAPQKCLPDLLKIV